MVAMKLLKPEPPNPAEIRRLLAQARTRLNDASLPQMSDEGVFMAAYDAAHAAGLAVLRWHGYRSDKRFVVFQALEHTLGWRRVTDGRPVRHRPGRPQAASFADCSNSRSLA